MTTGGGSSLTLVGFLCVCMVAPSAEVSVTNCNIVLFGLFVGHFVGEFAHTKLSIKQRTRSIIKDVYPTMQLPPSLPLTVVAAPPSLC